MKFLEDKEFEEMDWLTRAVEPHLFSLNDILRVLPDKYEFTYNELIKIEHKDISEILSFIHPTPIKYDDRKRLAECFDLKVVPGTQVNTHTACILSGGVTLVKTKDQFGEEDINNYLCNGLWNQIRYEKAYEISRMPMSEVHDLLDIFDCPKEAYQTTSRNKKMDAVRHRLEIIFKEDLWRIRNVDLAKKIATWTQDYIIDGNLGAFANLAKLKCMTLKNEPIYSMEEIV